MNRYRLSLYNSGGYKDREILATPYETNRDEAGAWQVIDARAVIGDGRMIEAMVTAARG